MNKQQLVNQIKEKNTFLCVGLDTDINKIPKHLLNETNPCLTFNKMIIDATAKYCVAYKPNTAFYESMGVEGMQILKETIEYIREKYPSHFIIADAKRGDIGNTSKMYAQTFFETYKAHAVTVAPYMGEDSVKPFLEYKDKWTVILALTSNKGSNDFQQTQNKNNMRLFEQVLTVSKEWGNDANTMYVVGATRGEDLKTVRQLVPNHFLLIPGIGAQGGSLDDVCKYTLTEECGILVNSSRAIIYADNTENFATVAEQKAKEVQEEMAQYLK